MPQKILSRAIIVCILLIIFLCTAFSGIIGHKTIVNETIRLTPGGEKAYSLPPGFVTINIIKTDTPIDTKNKGIGIEASSYGETTGTDGMGTLFGTRYMIVNPGNVDANVTLSIQTGLLNPFGYVWI